VEVHIQINISNEVFKKFSKMKISLESLKFLSESWKKKVRKFIKRVEYEKSV